MAYKKKNTSSIFEVILKFPWWFNLFLAGLIFASPYLLKEKVPQFSSNLLLQNSLPIINTTSLVIGALFTLFSFFGYRRANKQKYIFKKQETIKDIYNLTWDEFELLIKEVFIKRGYKVKQKGGAQADGGIDLEIYKNGQKHIVQCKQWKSNKVGVAVVREMFGVMIHEKAKSVYIVTCGSFTKDAKEFAKGKPVYLIHGFNLVDWIHEIKNN